MQVKSFLTYFPYEKVENFYTLPSGHNWKVIRGNVTRSLVCRTKLKGNFRLEDLKEISPTLAHLLFCSFDPNE